MGHLPPSHRACAVSHRRAHPYSCIFRLNPTMSLKWENKSCIFNWIYFFIFLFFILAHSFKHPAELEQTEPTASQAQTWPEAAFSPPPPLLAQHPTPFLGHVIVRRPGDLYPNATYVHIFKGMLFIKAHKQQTEL